ncbi:MAG: NADAR family protein [bacterium]|nr:NADAR family protein [bacterium]
MSKDTESIYTLDRLQQAVSAGSRFKYLFFWGHKSRPDGQLGPGCFSQWWPSPFVVEGITYPYAEHWMMAEKARLFNDKETLSRILKAGTPAQVKQLGREVRGFVQTVWDNSCFEIVVKGSYFKFSRDADLRNYLLATGKKIIVEASPRDRIWGIGMDCNHSHASNPLQWKGSNLLGFALMKARDRLARESKSPRRAVDI